LRAEWAEFRSPPVNWYLYQKRLLNDWWKRTEYLSVRLHEVPEKRISFGKAPPSVTGVMKQPLK
jgi:hypothetical protein